MLVMHGRWERHHLLLWAEDSSVREAGDARGRTRAQSVRAHPYAVPAERLATALSVPTASTTGSPLTHAVLDLPTRAGAPLPSPDLPEPITSEVSEAGPESESGPTPGKVKILSWRVPVVQLTPAHALALFESLSSNSQGTDGTANDLVAGGDLRHLGMVAAMAHDLALRGRVLPALVIEPPEPPEPAKVSADQSPCGRAYWLPLLTGPDAQRARDLALALPPVARAPKATAAQSLAQALDALTDAAVRRRLSTARLAGLTSANRRGARKPATPDLLSIWREALIGEDPWVRAPLQALESFATALRDWQADAVSGPVRAVFRLVEPPLPESAEETTNRWVVEFGLQSADEPSLIVDADRVWRSKRRLAAFTRAIPDPQETLLAELGRALRLYPGLAPALRTARPTHLDLDTTGAHGFLQDGAPSLAAAGFGVLLPGWWGRPGARLGVRATASTPAQPGAVDGPPALGQDALVDFHWEVALGDAVLTQAELTALADLQAPLVRVRGQWVELDAQRLRRGLTLVREAPAGQAALGDLLRVVGSGQGGPGELPVLGMTADGWLGAILSGGAQIGVEPVPVPESFAGTLRPYQQRGLDWLTFLQRLGLGAVLADDMGLGKTIQLLALMAADAGGASASQGDRPDLSGPTLLVCPMSVVGNWQREAARFAPDLRVHVHHGAERARGAAFKRAVTTSDLVVTTYALAARDAAALTQVAWRRVVLDEAQAVKNAATKAATAVRSLPARHRIAVTGTPVENRLADLWSLMEFANPGLLGSAAGFKQRFALPIERHADPDATARLRAVTQPFILRRLKTDRGIIADLPEKLEMEVVCAMTREQAALYQSVVDDMLARIADSEGMERRGLVLATMTKLKQVCNHPAQFLRDGSRLTGRSGKLQRLEEILEEVLATGEKALLFTQYTQFGTMLRSHLSARFGTEVLSLHGGVARADRDAMVSRFQSTAAGSPPVFVLSLKAGGTGLTLTEANHVIHVDRWWNPAVEDQATDRAHRIGQTRTVQVRKLVCGGTLEERISAMIRDKRGLAASVVGTGESWLTELSTDQIRELIRLDTDSVVE